MKTKKIFAKTLFLTVMFVIPGCSSFLDEENIAGQSAEEYFATAVGYESLLTGFYKPLNFFFNITIYNLLSKWVTFIVTQKIIDQPILSLLNNFFCYQINIVFFFTNCTTLFSCVHSIYLILSEIGDRLHSFCMNQLRCQLCRSLIVLINFMSRS